MQFSNRDDIIQLTPLWTGDRFDDGRPRVPDDILTRMEKAATEEAWSVLWLKGYQYQFEPDWKIMHPDKILVGRAVTAVYVPKRPDLHDCLMEYGHQKEGRIGRMNSWVIETLVKGDVMVVDLFGKIRQGTFSGGNLSTAIAARTGRGGARTQRARRGRSSMLRRWCSPLRAWSARGRSARTWPGDTCGRSRRGCPAL